MIRNLSKDSIVCAIASIPNQYPTTNTVDSELLKKANDSLMNIKVKYNSNQYYNDIYFLSKDSIIYPHLFNTTWEGVISSSPSKKLEVYFYRTSILTSGDYTWKEILDNKMYKEKKVYSIEDLKKAKWIIDYGGK
jgi:hypothetical protein